MEQELDLYALWQVIVKRWKLIVIMPLVAALVSLLTSLFLITPQYSADTTLMVTRPEDKTQILFQDIQVTRQLVATYREIVHSRRVMDLTIAAMNLPLDADDLREKVEVEAVRDTEIIIISVKDSDPLMARNIANEVARSFMNQVEEIMQIENVSVVDMAVTPLDPVSPRVRLNLAVAFMVGLMAAFGMAFLQEYLDRTIKDPEQAKNLLDLPVIGVIPTSTEGSQLFTFDNPRSTVSEAFRTLRTNIQYTGVDRQMKVILVSGANPECGKSTVSANLALTLAQAGSSVLIVDADMRRPTQHMIFFVANEVGLSSLVVRDDLDPDEVIINTEQENLSLLTCGPIPPYPAELLGSKKMKELKASLAKRFDYIVVDSPPIIAVTDAAVLSRLADGTIMVLDYGRVKREDAVAALEQMKKVGAHLIGSVLNNMPTSSSYYNGYHYIYGESDAKKKEKPKKRAVQR